MTVYVIIGSGRRAVCVCSTRPQAEAFKNKFKQDAKRMREYCHIVESTEEQNQFMDYFHTKWESQGINYATRLSIQEVELDPTA